MQRTFRLLVTLTAIGLLALGVWTGCGEMKGEKTPNLSPEVSFVTVPPDSSVFDFAPVIYWTGSDPDGFVEYYSFADVTDLAAIQNPLEYINSIPDEAWVDTIATQATIFLLTDEGDTTEHVFYVRCYDNEGAVSGIEYRRFFRTNNPPNTPSIGLISEDVDDDQYGVRFVVEDTLYSAPRVTSIYPGIQFSWRGSDPDDKALFKIPLQFQSILVRAPNDTVFVGNWTNAQEITLTNLETGYYTLNVWSRDDGLTRSVAPARAEFFAIRPTFQHSMLMIFEQAGTDFPDNASIVQYYDDLLQDVAGDLENVSMEFDGTDVQLLEVDPMNPSTVPPREMIHQYKLVVFVSDKFKAAPYNLAYIDAKADLLEDYLSVGGRVWMTGRMLGKQAFSYDTNAEMRSLLARYFAVDNIQFRNLSWILGQAQAYAEFMGTRSALAEHSDMTLDSTHIAEQWRPFDGSSGGYFPGSDGLSGPGVIERDVQASTIHYFISNTADSTAEIVGEQVEVTRSVKLNNSTINYPPTPVSAYLKTSNGNLESVSRVVNTNRTANENRNGEVNFLNNNYILVSYDEGQPWSNSFNNAGVQTGGDTVLVDYIYDPISQFHLKPAMIRYEGRELDNFLAKLRFRTALTTFAYYYMDYDAVREDWRLMLEWFYNPLLNR